MEELKKFDTLLQADERQKHFCVLNQNDQFRPLTIDYVYRKVSEIKLHDGVPEKIRNHFATAQNLLVYSWFFYPFNVTAQFIAFVSTEYALRERFKPAKGTFKKLIERAVKEKIVRDKGFSHIQEKTGTDISVTDDREMSNQQIGSYCKILIDTMPYLRNDLAHGSRMLHSNGAPSVRICAELINQLFPKINNS